MSHEQHTESNGFDAARRYPLVDAIFNRRTRRISKGLAAIPAGDLSFMPTSKPQPLSELEEAMLIAAIGTTGMTVPDRPTQDPNGRPILGSPNVDTMMGRAAGSPDNARATYFFLINDSGTYFLKQNKDTVAVPDPDSSFTPDNLIRAARTAKVKVLDKRLDLPRRFPYYLDSNRFLSNLEGTTILLPVVDLTHQYINGLMYLMTEEEGRRPYILDDRNFYLPAGVRRWGRGKSPYLNKKIKLTLGAIGTFRSEIEAFLLLQNVMLMTQAMGLGGWIHATMGPPFMLGHPMFAKQKELQGLGLNFTFQTPRFRVLDLLRWGPVPPTVRANPVGLSKDGEDLIRCLCPPNYTDMSAAVDALVEKKYGPNGTYSNSDYFRRIYKGDKGDAYLKSVPKFTATTIRCVKDVCNHIYRTHGRFPAHYDAVHVPGVWLQAHHLDLDYYDFLFRNAYGETQRRHQELWHSGA